MTQIVTARLRLRPIRREDLQPFVAYRREPEVARYQGWEDTYLLDDAERMFAAQEGLALGQPLLGPRKGALSHPTPATRLINDEFQAERAS